MPAQLDERLSPTLSPPPASLDVSEATPTGTASTDVAGRRAGGARPHRRVLAGVGGTGLALGAVLGATLFAGKLEPWASAAPAPPLKAEMTVRLYSVGHNDQVWVRLAEPGALPARSGDMVRVEVELSRPAHAWLLLLSSQGEVVPLSPWNGDEVKVADVDAFTATPPVRQFSSPSSAGMGWQLDNCPGLETILLLVREQPLPPGFKLRPLLGKVPRGGLRDPREVGGLGLCRGDARPAELFGRCRGVAAECRDVDADLVGLMRRLQGTFDVQRVVRFAHVKD